MNPGDASPTSRSRAIRKRNTSLPDILAVEVELSTLRKQLGRLRAEARVANRAARRLRDVADAIGFGLLLVSPDGKRVEFVSTAFSELWGLSPTEIEAHPTCWLKRVHSDDVDDVYELVKGAEGQDYQVEFRIVTPEGQLKWLHLRSYPIVDEGGKLALVAGLTEDITARRMADDALRESEERYRTLVEQASDAIVLTTSQGHILEVNHRGCSMLGYSESELLNLRIDDLIPPEDLRMSPSPVADLPAGERVVTERRFRRKNGALLPVEISARALPDGRQLGIIRDISRRRRAEDALRESEERYALAVRGANDGLWDWNLRTDRVYYSPRWEEMLGYKEQEIGSSPEEWMGRVHPDDSDRLRAELAAHLAGHSKQLENEHRMRHADGSWRWMLSRGIAVRDAEGHPTRMAGSQTDITKRKAAEYQLLHDAFHDSLTNLPNRALFTDRLERALQSMQRWNDYQIALLVLDIDRFKVINDSLGHDQGDQLLRRCARRLRILLRPGDTLARLGGDEFAFLLEDIGELREATRFAEEIQQTIARPFDVNGRPVYVTVSIGIAAGTEAYSRPEALLRDADNAMYRAKATGKAGHAVFDLNMHSHAVALQELETDLRRAVEHHEFVVHYQPIVSLLDRRTMGFEALVRWLHPTRGIVGPTEFIPLAEETGLILPLGRRVLFEACHQGRIWQDSSPDLRHLTMSVNISPRQFQQPDLVEQVAEALESSGLAPQYLKLEITESAFIDDADKNVQMLHDLRKLGVLVMLDDFGTGYSSLSYLTRFPVDALKIDQSFVKGLRGDQDKRNIIRAIVTMAHSLGLEVTAEGVETVEQLRELDELECEYGQGYLFSKPIPHEGLGAFLKREAGNA